MANIENTVNMTIRIDKDFKKEIDNLFRNLGLNTSSAIMMFLKQCNREQGIPFMASMESHSAKLISALLESEDIINGKINAKRYKNFDELVDDIDNK